VGDEPLAADGWIFPLLQGAEAGLPRPVDYVRKAALGPGVKERFAWGVDGGLEDITRARARREEIARRMAECSGRAVLALTVRRPHRVAPKLTAKSARRPARPRLLSYALLAARAAASVTAAGKLDGCPLGLSLIAARGNDTLPPRTGRQADGLSTPDYLYPQR